MTDASPPPVPLDRTVLASVSWERIHGARSWSQATIWGLEWEGRRLAIKDFAGNRNWLMRLGLARWTIRKEARIHRRLQEWLGDRQACRGGVPEFHGVIAGPALVMERLPVKRLPKRKCHDLSPAFFDALDRLLADLHAAGVAHGDVRRKNIALGVDGLPRLIDFTTAVTRPGSGLWPRSALFRHVTLVDRLSALRIRQSFFPDAPLTDDQRALLAAEPRLHRVGRWARRRLYRPFKKRVLRR